MKYKIGDEVKFNINTDFPINFKGTITKILQNKVYMIEYVDCFDFQKYKEVVLENEILGYWHEK